MTWSPYKPPDYPIQDTFHNPWVPIGLSGACAYDEWMKLRPISEAAFRAHIDAIKGVTSRTPVEDVSTSPDPWAQFA